MSRRCAASIPFTEKEEERPTNLDAPASALVFKIQTDPYIGRLAYVRVYSGVLQTGQMLTNSNKDRKERIGRLVQVYAEKREEITELRAGDIGAIVGVKQTFTGETLCDPTAPIVLEAIEFPEPVISIAVEPKTKADQDKLVNALQRLAEEDPTFRVRVDDQTGQTLLSGMGELHLEVLVDRMQREFGVQAHVGRHQVSYRETITSKRTVETRFVRQTGGRGQYAHVIVEFEPLERGKGFEFVDKVAGGAIPKEYIPAVGQGIRESMENGPLGGYSLVDIKATLVGGSFHEVDSSELAFKIAGSMALREASEKANPVLLEPVMRIEIVVPESVHRRRDRRPGGAPRADLRAGDALGRDAGGEGHRAVGRDVRLRHCASLLPRRAAARSPWSLTITRSCRTTGCGSILGWGPGH